MSGGDAGARAGAMSARALAAVEAIGATLVVADSIAEAAGVIARLCVSQCGARGAAVGLLDPRGRELAVRTGAGSLDDGASEPDDRLLWRAMGEGSLVRGERGWLGLPLRVGERCLGAVELDPGDAAFGEPALRAVAAVWSLGVERARNLEVQREARRRLRVATDRLSFLVEASRSLSESHDLGETLHRLAELAVPRLADLSAVHLLRAGAPRLTAFSQRHGDDHMPTPRPWLRGPDGLSGSEALHEALDSGVPTIVRLDGVASEARLASGVRGHGELRELGLGRVAVVPLAVHGRVLGAMTLCTLATSGRAEPDLVLAEELAIRAAAAIDQAQLHQDQARAIAHLQAGLLPPALPRLPGLELAGTLLPASRSSDVGGDFYDAVTLRDGRILLAVGDVQGKGVSAAATTGLVRQAVRAAAVRAQRPADVLEQVNEVLLPAPDADEADHRLCTVSALLVRPREAGADVTLASAGHPLPFLVSSDGAVRRVGAEGLIAGAFADAVWDEADVRLAPGEALVCVTDGVLERRMAGRFFEDELEPVLARLGGLPAGEMVEALQAACLDFSRADLADDMTLLVLRVPDQPVRATTAAADDRR